MTQQSDDELLSALLDGALTPDDAARLEQRLERELKLRARLDALERANTAVHDAYARVVDEPLPQGMLDLLGADAGRRDNVVPLAAKQSQQWSSLPLALAASIALVIGVTIGVLLNPRYAASPLDLAANAGAVSRGTALYEVFERAPAAEARELSAGVTATPVLTFSTASGDYCRELELASAQGATQMLACRRDGDWRLVLASYSASTSPDGVYRPASGPSPAIDAAIDELIEGAPLDAAAERELIDRGWSTAPR
jgi:hypothetical protein